MIVYSVTNKINGKVYIGQTKHSLSFRRKAHEKAAIRKIYNMYFHYALMKYGFNNFRWRIICKCKSFSEMNKKEIFYIAKYKRLKRSYNNTAGGDGFRGHHTKETKRKIGLAGKGRISGMKGKTQSLSARRQMSRSLKKFYKTHKMVISAQARKNMSIAQTGRKQSIEHIRKRVKALKGRIVSKETRRKLSIAFKGRKLSPEHREKISKTLMGRKLPKKTCKKMSIATMGRYKGKKHSEQSKINMSNAHIKYIYHLTNRSGNVFDVVKLREFCKKNGLNQNSLASCARANISYKGWTIKRNLRSI